jgi:hypothetical protein
MFHHSLELVQIQTLYHYGLDSLFIHSLSLIHCSVNKAFFVASSGNCGNIYLLLVIEDSR